METRLINYFVTDRPIGSKINSARGLINREILWNFDCDRIIFTRYFSRHSQDPFGPYKQVGESPPNLIRHNVPYLNRPLKFHFDRLTLTPVRLRQKSGQWDRQTDGLSETTFLDFSMVVHPKSGLISNSIFCTIPIFPYTEVTTAVISLKHNVTSFRNLIRDKHFYLEKQQS